MTNYRMRKLGRELRNGRAWIEGTVRTEQGSAWIVVDITRPSLGHPGTVWHVPIHTRPSWRKYLQEDRP
jgi:hypothetical protein